MRRIMFRKAKNILAGAILAATPLFTVLMPGIAHAATYTCTWTGATSSAFALAGNWSGCNSDFPQTADTNDIVFPVSAANKTITVPAGYTFNSITFNGTGSSGYNLSGAAFTLTGNVTDSSGQTNAIDNNVTVSGTRTVDVTAPASVHFTGTVSGTGSVTKTGTGTVTFDDLTLTGALTVSAGSLEVFATSSADATVSGVTVASGASFAYDAFTNSSVTTYTLSKPITSAGTLDFQGAGGVTLNLTGTVTLTDDTTIVTSSGETVHVQGPLHGAGFTLIASGSGVVLNESTDNTTETPDGDITGSADDSDEGGLESPDTGFAMASAHPGVTLAITLAGASALFAAARMARKSASRN